MKKGLRSFPAAIQNARFLTLTPFPPVAALRDMLSQLTPALRGQVLGEDVSAPFSHHRVGEGPGMRESAAIE